jgi:periplasmic protein TonB
LSASILLKHPAGFISLKAQNVNKSERLASLPLTKTSDSDTAQFNDVLLKPVGQGRLYTSSRLKMIGFILAILGHLAIFAMIVHESQSHALIHKTAQPMTVSIIAHPAPEPAPEPEVVPIIKPVKITKKTVVKPKKVVEKIIPMENPVQPMIEVVTEPVVDNVQVEEEAVAQEVVQQAAPAAPAIVEEKIEHPKFGVAYLNNPAPAYPRVSRMAGEEGRVLLKVLVSDEGLVNTVDIEKSSGSSRLDQSASDAVKRWRFIPARKGNLALSAFVFVPINFSLANN